MAQSAVTGTTVPELMTELAALEDCPTPPNCTSPFAPVRITEVVSRRLTT